MENVTSPTSLQIIISENNGHIGLDMTFLDKDNNPVQGTTSDFQRFLIHFMKIIEGKYERETFKVT